MSYLQENKHNIVFVILLVIVGLIAYFVISTLHDHNYEEYKSLQQDSKEVIDSLESTFSDRILLLNSYYNDAIHKASVNDMEIESLIVEKYNEIHYLKEQQQYLIELEKHNLQEYTEYWHTQYR